MIIVASAEKAAGSRHLVRPTGMLPDGSKIWWTSLIGPSRHEVASDQVMPGEGELFPHALLIEQPAHSHLRAHFHCCDQFQPIVGGSGLLGRDPVRFGCVHFTGPRTPYGPITDDGEGVHYLTLRNGWDPGAKYMPESRDQLRASRRAHRERKFGPGPHLSEAELAAAKVPLSLVMLPLEDDGLGAWFHRLPSAMAVSGPDPRESGGQYWVVMRGALDTGAGDLLKPFSCVFLSSDETPYTAKAGPDGLEILALQYPVLVKHQKCGLWCK